MSHSHKNDKGYQSAFQKPKDEGLNLMTGGLNERISEGDAIDDRERFMPPDGSKLHSTPGDSYGCFSGNTENAGDECRQLPPHEKEGKNFVMTADKIGGSGYADICINPYPEHSVESYGAKAKDKEYGHNLGGPFVSSHYPSKYFGPNPYKESEPGASPK